MVLQSFNVNKEALENDVQPWILHKSETEALEAVAWPLSPIQEGAELLKMPF